MHPRILIVPIVVLLALGWTQPVQAGRCLFTGVEGGEVEINTDNGAETAGKTGTLKCFRDGKLWREQELRNGEYIGLDRHHDHDGSVSERQINAKGNTHGLKREFFPGGALKSEGNYDNGSAVGLMRSFHANGKIAALRHVPEAGAQAAVTLEFNEAGQLMDLRCASKSYLAEDRAPCGFEGRASAVDLFDRRGNKRGTRVHLNGVLLSAESYNDAGLVAERSEFSSGGRVDRRYHANAVLAFEQRIEHDYVVAEHEWYMNGQRKRKTEREPVDRDARVVTEIYRDTGVLQSREQLRGRRRLVEEKFDEAGRLAETLDYDDEGRLQRQRKYATDGTVTRDDSFFPDGSRKSSPPATTIAQ